MYKKTIFGAVKTHDGYHIQTFGRNRVKLNKNRKLYFVFFEYLHTEPLSVQVDRSSVWMDSSLKKPLMDIDLQDEIIEKVVGYFEFRGIKVYN